MEEKVFFSPGVKFIRDDMNDLHELTETHITTIMSALSGGSSDFIFHKVTPSVVYAAPTITFTLADNWFSVNGFPIKIDGSAPTATPLGAPMKYAIYFVLSEDTTSDIRDWQSLVGTTITTNRSSIVIRDTKASRVEITEGFPVPAPPALGAGDIGSVLYATTEWDGAALVGTVLGTNFWSFPGDIAVAAAHAVTHLPGGADEVNAAALTGAGSTGGLMPVDSLDVLMNAVQDLAINVSSQYVTVSVAGDNVSAPKTATLGMRLYDSLAVVDDVGVKKLGLGFQVGAFDGTSVYPARQDHIHSSTNTPFFMDVYTYDIAATNLGALFPTEVSITGVSRIVGVEIYWSPNAYNYPRVKCEWQNEGTGTVGVRAVITSATKTKMELGSEGIVKFSQSTFDEILAVTGLGGKNWSGTNYMPRDGQIHVQITGARW